MPEEYTPGNSVPASHPATRGTRRVATVVKVLHDLQVDLDQQTVEASVRELSRYVAADEIGIEPGQVTDRAIRPVRHSLEAAFLPPLDELGIVDYEPDAAMVTATPATAMFRLVVKGYDIGGRNHELVELDDGWGWTDRSGEDRP